MPGRKVAAGTLVVLWGLVSLTHPAKSESAPTNTARSTTTTAASRPQNEEIGISSNPTATNVVTGTGWLGEQLGINKRGVRLGGVWVGGVNDLVTGGVDPGFTFNSSLVVDLSVDLERFAGLKGSSIGVDFLQLNNQATNTDAGSVLGYIGLASSEPFNRSELLEAWWRQELFDKHLVIRVGKSNPAIDFQDVMRPVTNPHAERVISTVTSLLYGPIFVLPTLYESLPAFYETAYGITSTWIPSERFYVSYGVYDGNKARGVATGLTGPEFNGYYFHIAEAGTNWLLGAEQKPGFFSVGGWRQTVVAYYYGDVDPGTADLGFYGFNGVLTAVAVFVVCGGKLRLSILGALIATMMIPAITGLGLQMVSAPYVFTTWLILGLGWIEDHWFDVGAEPEPIPAAKSHASARPAHGHTGN